MGVADSIGDKSDVILVGSDEESVVARWSAVVERCDVVGCVTLSVDGGSSVVVVLSKGGPVVCDGKMS